MNAGMSFGNFMFAEIPAPFESVCWDMMK